MKHFSSEIAKQKIRDSKAKMELELEEQRQFEEAIRQEELEEKKDKIQVQGLGVYTPKVLKDKVTRMSIDLAKVAKRGDWNKSSRNSIRALGEMWGALSEYEREK